MIFSGVWLEWTVLKVFHKNVVTECTVQLNSKVVPLQKLRINCIFLPKAALILLEIAAVYPLDRFSRLRMSTQHPCNKSSK